MGCLADAGLTSLSPFEANALRYLATKHGDPRRRARQFFGPEEFESGRSFSQEMELEFLAEWDGLMQAFPGAVSMNDYWDAPADRVIRMLTMMQLRNMSYAEREYMEFWTKPPEMKQP